MSRLVPSTLSHLSDSHLNYFRHWSHLLHLESAAERRSQSPGGATGIWLQSASERFVCYYYYYKICIAHKFKRTRVRGAGVARWGT